MSELAQLDAQVWRHLALVMNDFDDTVRFYIDGAFLSYYFVNELSFLQDYNNTATTAFGIHCTASSYNLLKYLPSKLN